MASDHLPNLALDAMTTTELDHATAAVKALLELRPYLGSVYRQTLESLDADLRDQHIERAGLRRAPLFSVYDQYPDSDPPSAA